MQLYINTLPEIYQKSPVPSEVHVDTARNKDNLLYSHKAL